jgi:hypothetical protein
MKAVLAAGVVGISLLLVGALFAVEPFGLATAALDRAFGAPPKWKNIEDLYVDPLTQETSRGEHPRAGFDRLAAYWNAHPDCRRVVFLGNSQMHSVNLAPGEGPPTGPEKGYVDLIPQPPGRPGYLFYRISLGGMSYSEALWYTLYLLSDRRVRPDLLVMQLDYQALLQAGIREGLLELIDVPEFRARVEAEAHAGQPYSDSFAEALQQYTALHTRDAAATSPRRSMGRGFGEPVESAARSLLSRIPVFRSRHEVKNSFVQMLYGGRVYLLRLKPSSPRSAPAVRLLRSQREVEEIIRVSRGGGVQPVFFVAPLNPEVRLYRTEQDRATYQEFLRTLAERDGVRVWNLENRLPERYWGRLMDGPDPLHFGREAHRVMAAAMAEILEKAGGAGN